MVMTPVLRRGDEVRGVVLQPDGKIVAAGLATVNPAISDYDSAVVRYNPDGSLDTTFDGDGKVTHSIGPDYDEARSVALQPDGKIVAAGVASNGLDFDFALLRYNPDGTLDTGFDGDGVVTTAIGGSHDVARSVALQPDGKILASGYAQLTNRDFAFVRYHPDGTLDTTFSGDGKVTVDLGGADVVWGVAVQPDQKIVAAGESLIRIGNRFALVRIFGV
ncbi:MAG: delta-60 repeat domain-containing protein, partial [Actinomycetota bacterium]